MVYIRRDCELTSSSKSMKELKKSHFASRKLENRSSARFSRGGYELGLERNEDISSIVSFGNEGSDTVGPSMGNLIVPCFK